MSIYLLETWIIKPEDEEEHRLIWEEFIGYMKLNPGLFGSIKSMKLFHKLSGNDSINYAQIVEFDNIEDKKSLDSRLLKDNASMEFHQKLACIKNVATTKEMLCEPFLEYG